MEDKVRDMLAENDRRNAEIYAPFDPITGEGSVGERRIVHIRGMAPSVMWLPVEMLGNRFVRRLVKSGDLDTFLERECGSEAEDRDIDRIKVITKFVRIRDRYDFPFWAAFYVWIKRKGGGDDCLFRLTRPQRKFVERLEEARKAGRPIRIVLLKARQWGGSTTSQIYMAWLQLVHMRGLNSLIIAHQGAGSDEILDMFDRLIRKYPADLLHPMGERVPPNEPKWVGVGKSGAIHRVPQRNCKVKVGTAERPDSCRGGDYNLVHLSEVGLWKVTDGKKPEDIVRSATSGILLKPNTMIVYESTANGTGNFFQMEYDDAKNLRSQFSALFVSWFDIEQYSLPLDDPEEFAAWLCRNRNNEDIPSRREECGRYIWWLWEKGATLEAIHWYIEERRKYNDHGQMAAEYPSDDVEAFVNSGAQVFDRYRVEEFRPSCRPPKYVGEVMADGDEGKDALRNIRFAADGQGSLYVWNMPEPDEGDERVTDRYLAVVDIGGRSTKSDWSVITVFDRLFMMDGGKPVVVAQWYGHTDMDLLSWKAAQIAAFYNNAYLVIESNTLETHDRERNVDGDSSSFILSQIKDVYDNLYVRKQSEEDIREGRPVKYGFHTNVSTKQNIIDLLIKIVRENLYVEREVRCLDEYLCYEKKQNGSYGAIIGKHDDLLMTRAIGLWICFKEMDIPRIVRKQGQYTVSRQKVVSAATI